MSACSQKSKHVLDYIQSSMASNSREGILLLYSTLLRHHSAASIIRQHRKDMELLDQVQRRGHKYTQRAAAPLL